MRNEVILEVANKWEAEVNDAEQGSMPALEEGEQGRLASAREKAKNETLRACADQLRTLVSILG